jgi:Flp pilus assembly pilin Flp
LSRALQAPIGFGQGSFEVSPAKQNAQDVVEYGLIIGTIALVILLATVAFGNQIQPWFQVLAGRITTTGVS